jgi:hypothetical protein
MPNSDVWLPLLIALLGLVGTITGVEITQRRSDRREDAWWIRERERERERQIREDEGRVSTTVEMRTSASWALPMQKLTLRWSGKKSTAGRIRPITHC